jgi:hypothetical protein
MINVYLVFESTSNRRAFRMLLGFFWLGVCLWVISAICIEQFTKALKQFERGHIYCNAIFGGRRRPLRIQ